MSKSKRGRYYSREEAFNLYLSVNLIGELLFGAITLLLRNHPLLLLSGVGTNAIGYDLSPECSFARYMSGQGFDTWILEVRGAGLSMHGSHPKEIEETAHEISEKMQAAVDNATDGAFPAAKQSTNVNSATQESEVSVTTEYLTGISSVWDNSKLVTTLTETFIRLSERLSGFLCEGQSNIISAKLFDQISRVFENSFVAEPFNEIRGKLLSLLEARQNSLVASQIRELSQKLVNVIEEGQRSVSPPLFDIQERLTTTLDDFQKQLDLMLKYDWDFDHYLEEDVPAACSFARYMSGQGFDTWILEVRGAGLSMHGSHPKEIEETAHEISEKMQAAVDNATDGAFPAAKQSTNVNSATQESEVSVTTEYLTGISSVWDNSKLVTTLTETFIRLSERLSGFLCEGQSNIISAKLFDQISRVFENSFVAEPFNEIRGKLLSLLEARQNSLVASQIRELSQKLVNVIEEGQRSVSPPLFDIQERLTTTLDDFQKQLDLMLKYDWDFDHYLEEDVPAAMEYIKAQTKPKDGKLLAIGHSMGGILLYAMLSRCCSEGKESGLAAIVTLASSVDYSSSKSSLKLLIPFAEPAQALNVPAIPLGVLLTAAYPFTSSPPYVLSWLNHMISAKDMMSPDMLKKLVLNNFCTIPAKLLLQLRTAFSERGLCDRRGTFFYKDHLPKLNVPVLALAGDQDAICPPEAVYETVKCIPENLVTYKVFGELEGPHYAHYDLVGGRMVVDEVYPCIVQFLNNHDDAS